MSLAGEQQELYALITGFGAGPKAAAKRQVVGTRQLPPLKRVRIYGDQYFWRLYEALSQDFPKLTSQLEERVLRDVVRRYARACPSRHWDLGRFGSGFVAWLAKSKVKGARADFVDLAALEWARNESFLALDAAPIDALAMSRVPAERFPAARLSFTPSCRLLWLQHSVAAAFEALRQGKPLPPIDPSPQTLIVWRKEFTVFHSIVAQDEAKALKAAMAGKPLAEVVAHFHRREDPTGSAFTAVGSWVTEEMVGGVKA